MEDHMFPIISKSKSAGISQWCVNWRAVGDIAGDVIGAASLFATGYILLLAGHGFGLN